MGGTQHEGHSDCSEVLHHIYEYLDGEMSPEEVRRVATHLAECRPCLAEHDLDAAVKAVVSGSLRRWACGRGWPCCPCASDACGRACSW
ncbi:MAG: zf-HC2 domain-containing protein [Micrococcales bacterium]|nr:zf-HC2 domain-containing protein [Micrococcales bacterium]